MGLRTQKINFIQALDYILEGGEMVECHQKDILIGLENKDGIIYGVWPKNNMKTRKSTRILDSRDINYIKDLTYHAGDHAIRRRYYD
jgi:hypothetical protein